jgi:hypothetical protein
MTTQTTDLNDPAAPDGIPDVLRTAADKMREATTELQGAWQDKSAGKVWERIAKELERCATRVEQIINQEG